MASANTGYVSSVAELQQVTDLVIDSGQTISLDCETGYTGEDRGYRNASPSLHAEENLIAGYSFTTAPGWARYVPVGHDETRYNVDAEAAALALWRLVTTGRVIVHNADAEERWLSRWLLEHLGSHPEVGAEVQAVRGYFALLSDTMMEAHALARWKSIGLKAMSKAVFNYDQVELIELFNEVVYGTSSKKLPKNKRFTLRFNVMDPSDPRVFNYACDDVIQTLRLHERLYPLVRDNNFIYWLEMHVWPIVWAMEDEGLAFDWDFVDEARARARQFQIKMQAGMLSHLTERLDRVPLFNGKPFNPNSFPQLTTLLYSRRPEGLGLTTHRKTRGKADGTGKKLSTDAVALKGLSSDPFVHRLQDYRGMTKLLSTYLEHWREEFGWCEDGRAHCHLLPHGTFTGRFSASDFNYQNLPKKYHYEVDGETFDFNFRNAVTVPDGWLGFGFDISQGELRIIAAEAGETAMLEAFERGEDLHALTASRLLHISMDEVYAGGELFGKTWSPDAGGFRPFGKTLNFALGYQLTVQGLADRLSCLVDEAQAAWDDYFAAYPAIAAWTRRTVADSKLTGCTQSRLGRRHPIWAYESDKSWIYAGGERTAGNAPIQGGLADMMKLIMIRCHEALDQAGLLDTVRMVMNIHDALEFYVRKDVNPQLVIDTLYPAIVKKTPWTEHWPVMEPEWHLWMRWGSPTELKLDENNQITGLGGAIDIGEEEYEDDEELDDGGVPAVLAGSNGGGGIGQAAAALGVPPAGVADGGVPDVGDRGHHPHTGRVIVRLPEMPEREAAQRFMALLAEFPGPNTMELATPEGSVPVSSGTSLSPEDGAGRIGMVLSGAQVVWSQESVDNEELARGLALLQGGGECR
jgi:DNA polymerase I-like protein with 3'-5' exonuclease and polymerase domains